MQAQQYPARTGIEWLKAGYALYRQNPSVLAAICTTGMLLAEIAALIHNLLGVAVALLMSTLLPLIVGNASRLLVRGLRPSKDELFEGVSRAFPRLLQLGSIFLLLMLAIILVNMLFVEKHDFLPDPTQNNMSGMLGFMLRLAIMFVPLLMGMWFSPILVGWHDVPAFKAVFFSFVAAWRNWRPFAVFILSVTGLVTFIPGLALVLSSFISPSVAYVVAYVIKIGLLLFFWPVWYACNYISYCAVFEAREV